MISMVIANSILHSGDHMNRRREAFLYTITTLVFFLFLPYIVAAQESSTPVQLVQVSTQDAQRVREAVDRGEISLESIQQFQKEGKQYFPLTKYVLV